jgi:pilus assembly protein Flp/PilA
MNGQRMKSQRGQGLVEYALILVLIAVIAVLILSTLGDAVGGVFSELVDEFNAPGSGGGGGGDGGGGDDGGGGGDEPPPPPECYGSALLPLMVSLMGAMVGLSYWMNARGMTSGPALAAVKAALRR